MADGKAKADMWFIAFVDKRVVGMCDLLTTYVIPELFYDEVFVMKRCYIECPLPLRVS